MRRPEPTTTSDPPAEPTSTQGGTSLWISACLGGLVLVTSLAVASFSLWLVPPYLVVMAALLVDFLPKSLMDRIFRRGRVIATNPGVEEGGQEVETETGASIDSESPSSGIDAGLVDEERASSLDAAPARSKKKPKSRSKKQKSSPPEPAPATWVQVAPGKFVRMEGPAAEAVPPPEVGLNPDLELSEAPAGEETVPPELPTEPRAEVEEPPSDFDPSAVYTEVAEASPIPEPETAFEEPSDLSDESEEEVSEFEEPDAEASEAWTEPDSEPTTEDEPEEAFAPEEAPHDSLSEEEAEVEALDEEETEYEATKEYEEDFSEDPSAYEPAAEIDHKPEEAEEYLAMSGPSPEELELAELERLTAPDPEPSAAVMELSEQDLERLTNPELLEPEGWVEDETVPRHVASAAGSSPAPVDDDRVEPVTQVAFALSGSRGRGWSSGRAGFRVTVNARTSPTAGSGPRRPRAEGRTSARSRAPRHYRPRSPPRSA